MRAAIVFMLLAGCGSCRRPPKVDIQVTPLAPLCRDATGICVPSTRLEQMLAGETFDVLAARGTASGTTGASTLWLSFPAEHIVLRAKWKESAHNGSAFNNEPRKEVAAYRFQQLFLEPSEYVVPPTVARCLPRHFYHAIDHSKPTFDDTHCILGVLAYWLEGVKELPGIDNARYESDLRYRSAIANLNLFTYLFDHRDSRPSNFVITADHDAPRAFAIDNGLALSGIMNPRTRILHEWHDIRVKKLPHAKIERLRKLTRADLDTLATVVQFRIVDKQLEHVQPAAPISDDTKGVRRSADAVQLGLTREEIDGVESRIHSLLARIDAGELEEY